MAKLIKKLLLSASVVAGVSTVGAVPAIAADFTVTGGSTSGSYTPDVILYDTWTDSSTGQTYTYENQYGADYIYFLENSEEYSEEYSEQLSAFAAYINSILDGDSSNPGGNIELFASSEVGGDFSSSTSLTGDINGKTLELSSLNGYDWFTDSTTGQLNTAYGANTLATVWFTQLWDVAKEAASQEDSLANSLLLATSYSDAYSLFFANGGFQAASDPNISYINSDGNDINIGLAGHYDLSLKPLFGFLPSGLQASEVVKYTYNGVTDYLYSFTATDSKLIEWGDQASHTGNYEVTIAGVASVPEPSTMIGLMTVGGLLAAAKKKGQSKKDA